MRYYKFAIDVTTKDNTDICIFDSFKKLVACDQRVNWEISKTLVLLTDFDDTDDTIYCEGIFSGNRYIPLTVADCILDADYVS